jgi:lipoyl synthase
VLAAGPDVLAHNLETVPRLSRQVRVQARYERSFAVLRHARQAGALTKTGLMLGLGEQLDEVRAVIDELGGLGLTVLTLGQYLQPSKQHLAIDRYVHPDEFAALREHGLAVGIRHVESGPLVRSSYHAEGQAELVRALQAEHGHIGFASLRPQLEPPAVTPR